MTFPPSNSFSNSFSSTHRFLALSQLHIDGNLEGAVQIVNVGIGDDDSTDPRRLFSRSMRALTMVSKHPLPLHPSKTPASKICKLWEDPFLRGSGCDLGYAKMNATGGD